MTRYTVNQGDHLSSIAESFGFRDFTTIWEHPDNASLRDLRKDPNVIAPGDEVVIPEIQTKEESCATEARHRFRVHGKRLRLRVRLLDVSAEPLANLACTLAVEHATFDLTSDGDGFIETVIPTAARSGWIRASDPERGVFIDERLWIGHLDPVDLPTGVAARLAHLGYDVGDDLDEPDPYLLRLALEEFQCDESLEITGEADDSTRAKLVELHGV